MGEERMGYGVMMGIDELWTVTESSTGQGNGGPEQMIPTVTVKGWKVKPFVIGSVVKDFLIVDGIEGADALSDPQMIGAGAVFAAYFPSREDAVRDYMSKRIDQKLQGLGQAFALVIVELRSELNGILKGAFICEESSEDSLESSLQ